MWKDYLIKSKSNLAAAERDLQAQGYDPCVSRAYYATYLAAIAALIALTDFQRRGKYWDHSATASEFSRRLILRQKVFPRNMAGTLDDLRLYRHQADYDNRFISRKATERSLQKARFFVQQIDNKLQTHEGS